jgi:hypothetical protein
VLFDEVLQAALLKVLGHVVLELEDDLGTTVERLAIVGDDLEGTTGIGDPSVLNVVIVLGDDSDLLGNQVSGVETYTELTDHADVGTGGDGLHEGTGTGLGDGTEIVDEIRLLHTDTSIPDGESVGGFVRDDLDAELRLSFELLGLLDRSVADLVEGIGGVGDKLSEEDLLVTVERVDDERHQLLNVSVEGESFRRHG